ncbi:MAG: glycosyltransferase family 4 protein [Candidatus Sungbacteria bacterium]|nr:glycosyltransferase family 4 protein [Candidatus Sungbacteria bacterium]
MKIGIVLHPYGEDKPAGLARLIFELTNEMIARDRENEYIIFLKHQPKIFPVFSGNNWKIEVIGGGFFWLDRLRKFPRADIYLFNTPALPLFSKPGYLIVLALDFAYWYFRPKGIRGFLQTYMTYWYHQISLEKADYIVTISNATKNDLKALFTLGAKNIETIYFGFRNIAATSPKMVNGLPEHFFLFTGVWKERKNVLGIVQAFSLFAKKFPEARLVLAGKGEGEYAKKLKTYIADTGLKEKIIMPGFVSDAELSYLYRHAKALLFPSFIEGFGFPILEAMNAGLPVITSNQSSLAEVAGDAASCVDPHNPAAIAVAMERLSVDETWRQEMREKGRARAQEFGWEQTVQKFLEIFKTIVGK